ncbi:hypothetical protein ADIARSV_2633 [Arcticibacter svalbardensis MN12-7]|uniref:Uncharacterized protein n=1 Tax=Arcticibacter svalbardensis MN12-7 TaxID=1150600 RepID=R9GQX2_9SPHI|nr:CehA/McbA family metallohydrolase [Arcticibacter svalbardensis]EOR94217.1 hypothetical protein ADIARSV_2633 [Arcticibacter svalbardensis MN12-7]
MKKSILIIYIFFCVVALKVNAAQIVILTKDNLTLLPKGKEVDGMIGDWVMKNDQVIAVIGAAYPDREANQMVSSIQGAIIDFSTLSANNDQLTVFYPQGARVDVPSADTIIVVRAMGAVIVLKALKYATDEEPYTAETTYTMKDGEDYIHVKTTYKNTVNKSIKLPVFDMIRGDNKLSNFTPQGLSNLAYINNDWYHSAYGVLSEKNKIFIPKASAQQNLIRLGHKVYYKLSDADPTENVTLNPFDSLSISRKFVTAADVSGLQIQQLAQPDNQLFKLTVSLKDHENTDFADVFLNLRNDKGELVSSSISHKNGEAFLYALKALKGKYKLEAYKPGHDSIIKEIIFSDTLQKLTLKFDKETKIAFKITDEKGNLLPVKVSFRGINGTKTPNFGPATRNDGSAELYYANSKEFEVPITPGDYTIVISHGPEYDIVERTVKVVKGKNHVIEAEISRAFTSAHYIIADLHNHTTRSGDSNAGVPDRIINMVAAGIEFAPATEHNRISTYAEVIDSLKLSKFIKSAAGIELSGRPGPGSTNHQIAFPLLIQPGKRGYGAPKTDVDPYVQMKRLYDYDNGSFKLMQQNHPEISLLYFDKNADGIKDKGYGTEEFTDVMEIRESMFDLPDALNGGNTNTRSFQWLQLLNLGYHIFGTANSDAHVIGSSTGALFNYVYTKHDVPEEINALEIAAQVKKGHVIMSNGPFMTVTVNDSLPGSTVTAMRNSVNMAVVISQAQWSHVNTVNVIINGKIKPEYTFTKAKNPSLFQNNGFNHQFPIKLAKDAVVLIMAYDTEEHVGPVTGKRNQLPFALSNPFFIDFDGGEFKTNHDMLGQVLPVKGKIKEIKD